MLKYPLSSLAVVLNQVAKAKGQSEPAPVVAAVEEAAPAVVSEPVAEEAVAEPVAETPAAEEVVTQ